MDPNAKSVFETWQTKNTDIFSAPGYMDPKNTGVFFKLHIPSKEIIISKLFLQTVFSCQSVMD